MPYRSRKYWPWTNVRKLLLLISHHHAGHWMWDTQELCTQKKFTSRMKWKGHWAMGRAQGHLALIGPIGQSWIQGTLETVNFHLLSLSVTWRLCQRRAWQMLTAIHSCTLKPSNHMTISLTISLQYTIIQRNRGRYGFLSTTSANRPPAHRFLAAGCRWHLLQWCQRPVPPPLPCPWVPSDRHRSTAHP